jgi:hypothetical protein
MKPKLFQSSLFTNHSRTFFTNCIFLSKEITVETSCFHVLRHPQPGKLILQVHISTRHSHTLRRLNHSLLKPFILQSWGFLFWAGTNPVKLFGLLLVGLRFILMEKLSRVKNPAKFPFHV